jgi:hypothetical protein
MALDTTQDNNAMAAPATDPNAPPVVNSPATPPGPDLSALSQPGASIVSGQPAPNLQTGALGSAQQSIEEANTANKKAADLASQPLPPTGYTGPHARLLSMIQGLSIGMSNFGKAMATGGREGGAEGVIADESAIQQQKINAQNAALAQKNAAVQTQITAGATAQANAHNYILLATMHDQVDESHFKAQSEQQSVIGQAQDIRTKALQDFTMTGDINAYNSTLQQLGGTSSTAGTPTGAPAVTIPPVAISTWKNSIDAAVSAYPNDSTIKQYAAVLGDSKSTSQQMALAANGANNRMAALDAGVGSRTKQQAADPLYKLESEPSEMTGDKAPTAVALLSSKLNDPNLPPDQKPRVQRLLNMAQQAQTNALAFKEAEERTKQSITDGDPKAAGALLQSGLVSPSQIVSSRKPQFAQQAFDEAIRLGGGTKDATGKWTGGTWSAVKAEAQYDYAKNPKTQNTLNLLTTMQQQGGSIDIAQRTFNTIPGKVDSKTFNKIVTGAQTEFGGTSTVAFKAAMTSLADEYAQVLQGGAATETTLQQAKDLIQQAYTKNQGAAAFDTIRADMAARQKGMIRDNPALNQMYPDVKAGGNTAAPVLPKNTVHVQIPGQPAGYVQATKLADFQKRHPDAKVIQ